MTIEAGGGDHRVSAADRITTIRAAIADGARPSDLHRPAMSSAARRTGGVLTRRGRTEATVDLMQLAGLKPYGVLCELTRKMAPWPGCRTWWPSVASTGCRS